MSKNENAVTRELRAIIAELRLKVEAQSREIAELRSAVVALMEPDMPRILKTKLGVMVLESVK